MKQKDNWPSRWGKADLESILEKMANGANLPQSDVQISGYLPISRIETIAFEKVDLTRVKYVAVDENIIEKYSLQKGDILFSHINSDKHLGKTAIFNGEVDLIHGVNLLLIRAKEGYDKNLLNYLFKHYRFQGKFIDAAQRAVNQSSINQKKLNRFEIPLIPESEQQRIVARLDSIFGHLDVLREKLDRIPELLKNFRQQVLTQAVTGELTREWREFTKDISSDDLLRVKQIKIDLIKNGAVKRSKLEPTKDEEIFLSRIPTEWSKTKLESIFDFIDYRGKTPKKTKSGIRLITASNIKMGSLADEPIDYMSKNDFDKWMTRGFPKKGDLFFVTEGATMGNVALNDRTDSFALAQRTLTLHNICNVNSEFYLIVLLSNFFQRVIEKNATGTAARGIKAARFKNLTVPFPSLNEQKIIVEKVGSLFKIADKIESHYQSLKAKIDQLPQAVLAKAFRGELVGQEVKEYVREVEELGMVAENIVDCKSC